METSPAVMRRAIAGILAPVVVLLGLYLWGRSHPHTVSRSVEIAAPAERVWAELSDLASYGKWNPEIKVISGRPVAGTTLDIRVRGANGATPYYPTVVTVTPGRELRWRGRYRDIPQVADADHRFTIAPAGPGLVRFTQTVTFRGFLVPFFGRSLDHGCARFDAMNAALKRRAEAAH